MLTFKEFLREASWDNNPIKFKKPNFPILWVLSKGGSDDLLKGNGQIIKLDDK